MNVHWLCFSLPSDFKSTYGLTRTFQLPLSSRNIETYTHTPTAIFINYFIRCVLYFMFLYYILYLSCEVIQPTFQHQINFVSTLWINVEITLIRRWKWNKIRCWILNVAQRWHNVGIGQWYNVETTLIQLYLNVVSTWPQQNHSG